ncbi:hypothetical protein AJ80_08977 [Polytolypa hystricis UAMH7299]|uniref:RING zinc finger-like domain-containing protein n=1 Tax=Polytolypa hystricis (strain UAMH7299) TaxID=1447883 RepID=A0A2B7WYN2_POLH7|nr:hypothetical protein AJ80_08977 [Polytolypa hystricis UAMH7299]
MPPRSSLTSSFSVSDANNEVVCPLTNNDGSNCRKRCLGEKRYRSMQEHIRRAHPDHYIPKLPATEESFQLMVNTPPDQRPHHPPSATSHPRRGPTDAGERDVFGPDHSSPVTPRTLDEAHPAAATAAVALAQLHHHRLNSDWDSEVDVHSDTDIRRDRMHTSIELPPLRDHLKQESLPPFQSSRPRELLPSILGHSPPGRSSTLPPIQRTNKISRSRKNSLSQRGRRHDRNRSKEFGRRPSLNDRKAMSAEPQTASWVQGKRWEDLIEAATSATEVDDRDLTPVPKSPSFRSIPNNITSAPSTTKHRSSMPPAFQGPSGLPTPQPPFRQFAPLSYSSATASPLQKALTPPPYDLHGGPDNDLEPFPSLESSLDSNSSLSGKNFHMSSSGLPGSVNSDSSPLQLPRPLTSSYPPSSHPQQLQNHGTNSPHRQHHRQSNPASLASGKDVQIYCACCKRPWALRDCFACTECICGVCRECVGMMVGLQPPTSSPSILNPTSSPGNGISGNGNIGGPGRPTSLPSRRGCPSCGTIGGRWKGFQLDFRL